MSSQWEHGPPTGNWVSGTTSTLPTRLSTRQLTRFSTSQREQDLYLPWHVLIHPVTGEYTPLAKSGPSSSSSCLNA